MVEWPEERHFLNQRKQKVTEMVDKLLDFHHIVIFSNKSCSIFIQWMSKDLEIAKILILWCPNQYKHEKFLLIVWELIWNNDHSKHLVYVEEY